MTPVSAYLKKLLYQYDCVVVPELGGFLTHYQSATYSEATGQYLPPRKRLAYNEALRLDDGMLTNFLMLHENLTREEALRKISAFVTELRQEVQRTGCVDVEGIGLFTPGEEGKLQFDPELRHNFFGEAYGMAPISVERVSTDTEEPIEVEAVSVMALGPVRTLELIGQTPYTEVYRPQRVYLRWAAAAVVVGALGALSYFSVIKPGQPLQSSLNPATVFGLPSALTAAWHKLTQAAPVARVSQPSARPAVTPPSATPISEPVTLTVTPAVPVVAEEVTRQLPEAVTPIAVRQAEVISPEPEKKAVVVEAIPQVAPRVRTHQGPLFVVIAGSFANKDNALRFRRKLHKAGYDDAYIILPNESTRLYKVAAVGFPKRLEAVSSLDSLNQLTGIPAFIMRY